MSEWLGWWKVMWAGLLGATSWMWEGLTGPTVERVRVAALAGDGRAKLEETRAKERYWTELVNLKWFQKAVENDQTLLHTYMKRSKKTFRMI